MNIETTVRKLDQDEALAELDSLTAQSVALEKALTTAGKTFGARQALDHGDLLLAVELASQALARLTVTASQAGLDAATIRVAALSKATSNPVFRAASAAWGEPHPRPTKQTATDVCRITVANARATQKSQATARYNAAVKQ